MFFYLLQKLLPVAYAADTLKFSDTIKSNFKELGNTIFGVAPTVTLASPALIVAAVMRFLMGGAGVVFLILTLYAGFKWQGAAGNDEQVEIAKKTLTRAVIGTIVSIGGFIFLSAIQTILVRAGLT